MKYTGGHPHFIVSTMARGGFSGGPDELIGTATLGIVTEGLAKDGQAAELGYTAVLTVEPITIASRSMVYFRNARI